MTKKSFTIAAGMLALGLATMTTPSKAQGPLYDKVNVNLPYSVTIGDRTLQPGDYTIRQLPSPGGASRVLLIYSNDGMKFETSALTIPALDNRTPEDTKVVLHHFGPEYYFDKIWIQGKNYGYEFPLPDSVKARQRERMEPISVAARYESVPEPTQTETTTTAQNTTTENNNSTNNEPSTVAQNTTPAPAPEAQPAPAPAPEPAPAVTDNSNNASNSNVMTADRRMPRTSAGWLGMLLGGGLLSGAGLTLRRKR